MNGEILMVQGKSEKHTCLRSGGLRSRGIQKRSVNEKPLVSIITVVLNGKDGFERTLESVRNQTYDNIEYLVVDGGSIDGTTDIIRNHDGEIDYWVSEPDRGISDGFNKGIILARGEIIGILNCEDWLESDTVRTVVDAFLSTDADIVHGMMQLWDHEKKREFLSANYNQVFREMTVNHPTVFVRRVCYEKLGNYRLDFYYAMDYEWVLRAKHGGVKSVFVNRCLANMRTGGVSSKFWRKALKEVLRAQQIHNPGIANYLMWYWQNVKGTTSRFLNRLGMRGVVRYYHGHFSTVTKIWRD